MHAPILQSSAWKDTHLMCGSVMRLRKQHRVSAKPEAGIKPGMTAMLPIREV